MKLSAAFSNRRFALYAACSLVICLALHLTWHWREIESPIVKEGPSKLGPSVSEEDISAGTPFKRRSEFSASNRSTTPASLTSDEQGVINELSFRLAASLQAIEKRNAETAFEFKGGNHSTIALKVTALNENQTREAYLAASKLTDELSQPLQAAWRVTSRAILVDYTTFKKPYKILILSASPRNRDVVFVEKFVSDPDKGLPDESGILHVNPPDDRMDSTWGNEDSWAFRRYRHLVDIENGDRGGHHPTTTARAKP